jgi:hypothetical protein
MSTHAALDMSTHAALRVRARAGARTQHRTRPLSVRNSGAGEACWVGPQLPGVQDAGGVQGLQARKGVGLRTGQDLQGCLHGCMVSHSFLGGESLGELPGAAAPRWLGWRGHVRVGPSLAHQLPPTFLMACMTSRGTLPCWASRWCSLP